MIIFLDNISDFHGLDGHYTVVSCLKHQYKRLVAPANTWFFQSSCTYVVKCVYKTQGEKLTMTPKVRFGKKQWLK